jgi:hypothetical protein
MEHLFVGEPVLAKTLAGRLGEHQNAHDLVIILTLPLLGLFAHARCLVSPSN